MNPAFKLLTDLSIDPFRLDDFLRDPDPLARETGVAAEDLARVARPADRSSGGPWSRCAACMDPGYDPLPDPEVPSLELRARPG